MYNPFEMRKGLVLLSLIGILFAAWAPWSRAAEEAADAATLEPVPLTQKTFKEFGQVVEAYDTTKPTSESAVHKYWAGLAKTKIHENIDFGLLIVKPRERRVAEMRRHVKTTKLLVSLRDDYLLVVASPTPPNARRAYPDPRKVKVFMVAKDQAVILKKGVWHTLPFVGTKDGLFLVAYRDGTARSDDREKTFRKGEVIKF